MPPFEYSTALAVLARKIHHTGISELQCLGLGPGQLRVLFAVLRAPGIQQSGIARNLGINKSVVSRAVKVLLEAGYLKAKFAPGCYEARVLIPTRMAIALKNLIDTALKDLDERLTYGFSDEELTDLKLYMQRMEANLGRQLPEPLVRSRKINQFTVFLPVDF